MRGVNFFNIKGWYLKKISTAQFWDKSAYLYFTLDFIFQPCGLFYIQYLCFLKSVLFLQITFVILFLLVEAASCLNIRLLSNLLKGYSSATFSLVSKSESIVSDDMFFYSTAKSGVLSDFSFSADKIWIPP